MNIRFKKTHPLAQVPAYKTQGAACFDFHVATFPTSDEQAWILPGRLTIVNTGLVIEVPEGHCLEIFPRSGLAHSHGICLANGTGIVDSDYRGEILILLTSLRESLAISSGDRIAQGRIVPIQRVAFHESELSDTARGAGGFGSTGR